MTSDTGLLAQLEASVSIQDMNGFDKVLDGALKNGIDLLQIETALLKGLDRVRKRILSNAASLPELLVSLDLTSTGLEILQKEKMKTSHEASRICIVMGVVEGDPHDLGKNIISLIYKSYGFRVIDLGAQVPKSVFIETVSEKKPEILGLSAMMSTTMTQMPEIIKGLKAVSPDTLVMVGGAPLDDRLATSYGADGYAPSAVTVIEETKALLQAAER